MTGYKSTGDEYLKREKTLVERAREHLSTQTGTYTELGKSRVMIMDLADALERCGKSIDPYQDIFYVLQYDDGSIGRELHMVEKYAIAAAEEEMKEDHFLGKITVRAVRVVAAGER